jgi:tetratricopeptide (TPR) repeat protein
MTRKLTFRQLIVLILALWYDLTKKKIGIKIRMSPSRLSQFLKRQRQKEIDDDIYEALLSVVSKRPAEVSVTRAFLEALDALDREGPLTEEEKAGIEEEILHGAGLLRRYFSALSLWSRSLRLPASYPQPFEVPVCRHWAEEQLAKLKQVPRRSRFGIVRLGRVYQHWALVEKCCEESVQQASRHLKNAALWARLAVVIARFVTGPEGWILRVRAYALAHWANIFRVRGELKAAETRLEEAKALWQAGSDPDGVLDPGRLLDLEGSLRRDQRRFDEAIFLFDQAGTQGRSPERALIMKGTTYDVMGKYEQAVEAFLLARPLVERRADPRLAYMLRFNTAAAFCHLGRFSEAAELLREVRDLVFERNDRIEMSRVIWLEGRILAGLGRPREARRYLAEARERFAAEAMFYDVALALLEETGLLLGEGRVMEVKALTLELAKVFDSKGVHREALAALQIFQEAVEQETATVDLARRVLRFLFRARHDQGLRFES